MRILLVEDEPTLREQLRAGLAQAGYVVEQADNGRDAHFLGESEVFAAWCSTWACHSWMV
jgi:two-component system OmpR family response regulator